MNQHNTFRAALGSTQDKRFHIGFLLIPGFSLLSYASALEPLRAANSLAGRDLFQWSNLSQDDEPVMASNGVCIPPDIDTEEQAQFDIVFVCAGPGVEGQEVGSALRLLRCFAARRIPLGGICGGPYVLACAGLLDGHRATVHWNHIPGFTERFHKLEMTGKLYEIDRDRVTCSGGIAPLDLMHMLISQWFGEKLAGAVSDWCIQNQPRLSDESQRAEPQCRHGTLHPKLLKALALMEDNLEEPVSRDELAKAAGTSLRQLERLFNDKLGDTIGQHYLALRLDRARTLMQQTPLPVLEVAVATGFVSPTHFSRAYKQKFGYPPTMERRKGANPGSANGFPQQILKRAETAAARWAQVSGFQVA